MSRLEQILRDVCAMADTDPQSTYCWRTFFNPRKSVHRKAAASRILCEFLEYFTHLVLYYRGIYPASTFQTQKYLGIPVQVANHPDIVTYIRSVLTSLEPYVRKLGFSKYIVAMVTDKKKRDVVERFVVDMRVFEYDLEDFPNEEPVWGDRKQPTPLAANLHTQLRDCLHKIQLGPRKDYDPNSGLGFKIFADVKSDIEAKLSVDDDFPWESEAVSYEPDTITAIESVEEFKFDVYIDRVGLESVF